MKTKLRFFALAVFAVIVCSTIAYGITAKTIASTKAATITGAVETTLNIGVTATVESSWSIHIDSVSRVNGEVTVNTMLANVTDVEKSLVPAASLLLKGKEQIYINSCDAPVTVKAGAKIAEKLVFKVPATEEDLTFAFKGDGDLQPLWVLHV